MEKSFSGSAVAVADITQNNSKHKMTKQIPRNNPDLYRPLRDKGTNMKVGGQILTVGEIPDLSITIDDKITAKLKYIGTEAGKLGKKAVTWHVYEITKLTRKR